MPKWVKRGYGNTISEVIVNAAGVSEQELLHTELEDPRNIANLKGTADAFIDAVSDIE